MEYIAVGAKVFGAFQQMQMGKAQQQLYNMQAKQAEMQAKVQQLRFRSEAINHKRQGVQVLKRVVENLATINARAAAGSIDPFSGSVANLAIYNLGKGVSDFYTTKENQEISKTGGQIAIATGAIQSAQYIGAGNLARRQGMINAFATLSSAGMQAQDLGMFNFNQPVTPTDPAYVVY